MTVRREPASHCDPAIAFVAAGWWDVPGGIHAGMQGVWINRQETLWEPYEVDPDLTIESFHELADELAD